MTTNMIDQSQRVSLGVAGLAYLITVGIYANFGIQDRLISAGNPAQTVRTILAVVGALSSAGCARCTAVLYIFSSFVNIMSLWWFRSPMGILDLVTSFLTAV